MCEGLSKTNEKKVEGAYNDLYASIMAANGTIVCIKNTCDGDCEKKADIYCIFLSVHCISSSIANKMITDQKCIIIITNLIIIIIYYFN